MYQSHGFDNVQALLLHALPQLLEPYQPSVSISCLANVHQRQKQSCSPVTDISDAGAAAL